MLQGPSTQSSRHTAPVLQGSWEQRGKEEAEENRRGENKVGRGVGEGGSCGGRGPRGRGPASQEQMLALSLLFTEHPSSEPQARGVAQGRWPENATLPALTLVNQQSLLAERASSDDPSTWHMTGAQKTEECLVGRFGKVTSGCEGHSKVPGGGPRPEGGRLQAPSTGQDWEHGQA